MATLKKNILGLQDLASTNKKIEETSAKWDSIISGAEGDVDIPFYVSGARVHIRIGGKPVAHCQSVQWQISYNATPINTIDTSVPWDIDIGHLRVSAKLDRILSPVLSPEVDALFAVMAAAVHQPQVEMQVLDNSGTSVFFTRGIFTELSGGINMGSISQYSAKFIGTFYQHYVAQSFFPYNSISGAVGNLANQLNNLQDITDVL